MSTGKNTAVLEGYTGYDVKAMTFAPDGKTLIALRSKDLFGTAGAAPGQTTKKLVPLIESWDVATGKRKNKAMPLPGPSLLGVPGLQPRRK